MRIALLSTFAASRKEPLVTIMNRVHQAFRDAGLKNPSIRFNFGDHPTPGFVSSVDRVLKRYPNLERFVTEANPVPGIRGARRISNGPLSQGAGEGIPCETLEAIAAGVPRSFPFHSAVIHFVADDFGTLDPVSARLPQMLPGVLLTDSWWVNGRNRSLSACTVVEAEPAAKKLPVLPSAVAAVLAGCGKVTRRMQVPVPGEAEAAQAIPVRLPIGSLMASANPEAARKVKPVVDDYRARLGEIVERAGLPHDLPPHGEAPRTNLLVPIGPRKPALERAFAPLGYSCKGNGAGIAVSFTLRRHTQTNLTVELTLDTGTSVLGFLKVLGLGFKASLMLPVSARAAFSVQYPIGGPEEWTKIVENLATLVKHLDATFVPEIEQAAGPSPEWYDPDQ